MPPHCMCNTLAQRNLALLGVAGGEVTARSRYLWAGLSLKLGPALHF